MSAPLWLLGVDGGGTSTVAWLAREDGEVVGRGQSGPSNAKAVGPDKARAALEKAIEASFASAGLERTTVDVACLGLAGFDRPEDREALRRWSEASGWSRGLILVNDGDLVVAAGTPDGWGVGLIAGTGSIAVGRGADGSSSRAGGWGHLMGDEGSAYDVVCQALRLVARTHDRRSPSTEATEMLAREFCRALCVDAPPQLVLAVYRPGFDRTQLAALAPLVLEVARSHSELMEALIQPAGRALAEQVVAAATALDLRSGPLPLALAGGFLLASPEVQSALINRLETAGYRPVVGRVPDPVLGAVLIAKRGDHASG